MRPTHSAAIVILLAIIAGVLLFGASVMKTLLLYALIGCGVLIVLGLMLWFLRETINSVDTERKASGVGYFLIPAILTVFVLLALFGWVAFLSFYDGANFNKVYDQQFKNFWPVAVLFAITITVLLIEAAPIIATKVKGLLLKWWYFLISPFFAIQGAANRIAKEREEGAEIGAVGAFFNIAGSFLFSIILSLIAMLGMFIVCGFAWLAISS